MGVALRQGRQRNRQLWSRFHHQKSLRSRRYQKVASAKHIRKAFDSQRSYDAGVNLGLFGVNEHRLSSLRDFLELDLSQPTSSLLLDSRVYTQK